MVHIQVISVGKMKEKFIQQGIEQFEKRLRPYCKLTFTIVKDEPDGEQLSEKELGQIREKEGERILQQMKPDQHVIALDMQGENWTSERLAHHLQQLPTYGRSRIAFIIGGSNGLSKQVLKKADQKLSFGSLTFPHQLMKLMLLEQIYRAYKIQRNEPYHK